MCIRDRIQSDLFQTGAWLATRPDALSIDSIREISLEQIEFLENAIDRFEKELPVLKAFILPGGHITAAWAHVARTVCRRYERKVVQLFDESKKGKTAEPYQRMLVYINRLSDYLFVLARKCNHLHGVSDKPWRP